jgi:SAM-dependent methyltransferase
MNVRNYTQQNRRAWNEIAGPRRAKACPPEFFIDGKVALDETELREAGDVRGLRLLNLQCSSGNEALSWAVLGAEVTGVDISDVAIEIARDLAAGAGLRATFVTADVYELPREFQRGDFDIVFSSAGILCWLPDIWEWGRVVARALKPGGRLIFSDHHPVRECIWFTDGAIEVDRDYFGRGTPHREDGGLGVLALNAPSSETHFQFCWPLGDVVTALIRAGMRIDYLEEFPGPASYYRKAAENIRVPELAERLPDWYQLTATRLRSELSTHPAAPLSH